MLNTPRYLGILILRERLLHVGPPANVTEYSGFEAHCTMAEAILQVCGCWRTFCHASVIPAISPSIRSDGFIGSLCLAFLSRFSCEWFHCNVLFDRSLRNKSSNDMAFPHPKSRKENYTYEDKPSSGGVVWDLFKRTINITDYRNGKDDVNPANNRTFSGIFHD